MSALRTPLTKAKRGGLNNTKPEQMLAHVFKAVLKETGLNPALVEDVCVGNVLLPGSGAVLARAASIMANIPIETTVFTVNRFCSSGLEACSLIASKISSGLIECGIGSGVESMTLADMNSSIDVK